jgi:hypothetical protein
MDIQPLEMVSQDKILVACVLTEEPYVVVRGGVEYKFTPLKQFVMNRKEGRFILARAAREFRDRKEQSESERHMWAKKKDSPHQRERDQMRYFADDDGNPVTKPFPRVPLVDLTTDEGQSIYSKVWEEEKAAGRKPSFIGIRPTNLLIERGFDPDPDAGNLSIGESKKFEREMYEETERVPVPASHADPAEEPAEDPGRNVLKVRKPTARWSQPDLVSFVKAKGFTLTKYDLGDKDKLLDLAGRAHASHLQRMTASGVAYEEV